MKNIILIAFCICCNICNAQHQLTGLLIDEQGKNIVFATCAVYSEKDSSLVKAELTDAEGKFEILDFLEDSCYMVINYIGLNDLVVDQLYFNELNSIDLGTQTMTIKNTQLEAAIVLANKALFEMKSDRIVFNVEGTINGTGNNASQLLRKAPGISIGGNGAIKVLGRTGILLYINGKNSGLSGEEMDQYLDNLNADQIDKIEIIHNPGVKYDAQGNAGIIDVKLKKNELLGLNSDISLSLSQGKRGTASGVFNINYKNNKFNLFGTFGYGKARRWSDLLLASIQNDFSLEEYLDYDIRLGRTNFRYGFDYFINPQHTIGFLGSRVISTSDVLIDGSNQIGVAGVPTIDSVLISKNISERSRTFDNLNFNYKFDNKKQSFNLDLDYGNYFKETSTDQPNSYFTPFNDSLLRVSDKHYLTEIKIKIYSTTLDYGFGLLGGQFDIGAKWSKVQTENEFLFYDIANDNLVQNKSRSNLFDYDEQVYATYFSYSKSINKRLNFSVGSRIEQTYSTGDLTVFEEGLAVDPIDRDYLKFFPNLQFSYTLNPKNSLTLSYGKRINRPNYRRLNPFKSQVNELGFDKGNPFLVPEIANNLELGYSIKQRYHFKLAFSKVENKIVGLIAPDDESPLAGFLGYDNLAVQEVVNFSINAPFSVNKNWSVSSNLSLSHTNNNADYDQGITIATNAYNFSFNQTHNIVLTKYLRAEVSGWYSGSDIWDGITYSRPNYSFSTGLKSDLFNNKLSIQLNVSDIFYSERFKGTSSFNGRVANTVSFSDSRRLSLRLKYKLGNRKVSSRKRVTGMESEQRRTRG